MKQDVASRSHESVELMIEAIEQKWSTLSIEFMNKVIDHHANVARKILMNKGGYI